MHTLVHFNTQCLRNARNRQTKGNLSLLVIFLRSNNNVCSCVCESEAASSG